MITTWYLQSQRTWDKLCHSCIGSSFLPRGAFPEGRAYAFPQRLHAGSLEALRVSRPEAVVLAINNSPTSWAARDRSVVQLREDLIEHDLHVLLETIRILPPRLVHLVEDVHRHLQARAGRGLLHQLLHQLHAREDHPTTRAGQMREQPMLNRVVLGGGRRVVRHPDLNPNPIDQPLQVLLEQVLASTVAATAIAQQQDRGRSGIERSSPTDPPALDAVTGELAGVVTDAQVHVPIIALHIVQPVRDHHTRGGAGEVMIEGREDLLRVEMAVAVEGAQQLLLLRVDAQDRVVRLQVLLLEPGDVLELLVAVGMLAHGLGFLSLALDITILAEQLLDHGHADRCAGFFQPLSDLRAGQIGPPDPLTHRVACGVVPQHAQEVLFQPGHRVEAPLASAPWPSDPPRERIRARGLSDPLRAWVRERGQFVLAVADGLGIAAQDGGDVVGTALSEFGGLEGGIAPSILLRERVVEGLHVAFELGAIFHGQMSMTRILGSQTTL